MTILFSGTVSASPVPLRGVVEGFYGKTWTTAERIDMMNFCRTHSFNAYIYAPKDDPYHRDKWREPYPAAQFAELKKAIDAAKTNHIRFIFAVSPGKDLRFSGEKGQADLNAMLNKFEAVYKLGVRDFAIFFDDIEDKNGTGQARFINAVQAEMRSRHKDIQAFLTVPTEYCVANMITRNKVNGYTEDFSKNLDKKVTVLYTGQGVVCPGISNAEYAEANKIYGRELGVWWNYPVNDYTLTPDGEKNAKLALGAIENLPTVNLPAIFFNPMGQENFSKIALATGADYANSPNLYDPKKSWNRAIEEQFGALAPDMKIFASHSQHMENNWANVGAEDGRDFETAAYLVLSAIRGGRTPDFAPLEKIIDDMEKAAYNLKEKLPEKYLSECRPQLEQFLRIAQADRLALKCLESNEFDPQLKNLRAEISRNEKVAVISEKSALKFVDDVIAMFNKK